MKIRDFALLLLWLGGALFAQQARVRNVAPLKMPGQVDSNSPAYWANGQLFLLNSTGDGPVRSSGSNQFHLSADQPVGLQRINPWPTWMEAVWRDPESGIIFGWYHQEHFGVCPGSSLSVPQIGAAVSFDDGNSFQDMGAILSSGDPIDCASQNGYFAGGHGDFSVMLDKEHSYFYFFFSNYGGPVESQGICVARLGFYNRFGQPGAVMKYYNGGFAEPGLGGHVTPVFPAKSSWMNANADSFWGPSIHWNTYLKRYVMLLNRSCCTSGFPQKGIYISYGSDLGDPTSWTHPLKLMNDTGWYPQVLGDGEAGSDKLAGRVARLYIYGYSYWTIEFEDTAPADTSPTVAASGQ